MLNWNTCAARVQCSVKVCTTTLSVSDLCDSGNTGGVLEDEIRRTRVPVQSVYNSPRRLVQTNCHTTTLRLSRWLCGSPLKCPLLIGPMASATWLGTSGGTVSVHDDTLVNEGPILGRHVPRPRAAALPRLARGPVDSAD